MNNQAKDYREELRSAIDNMATTEACLGIFDDAMKSSPVAVWTKESPKEPGWYWWRYDHTVSPEMTSMCHLTIVNGQLMEIGCGNIVEPVDDGEWSGPLHPPQEGGAG